MAEDKNINDITGMIMNKDYVRNDIIEITNIINKILNEKYVSKMNELVLKHKEKVINDPPKEVMLMEAIKPFLQKEARFDIDKIIEMINMINAAKSIQVEVQRAKIKNINNKIGEQ